MHLLFAHPPLLSPRFVSITKLLFLELLLILDCRAITAPSAAKRQGRQQTPELQIPLSRWDGTLMTGGSVAPAWTPRLSRRCEWNAFRLDDQLPQTPPAIADLAVVSECVASAPQRADVGGRVSISIFWEIFLESALILSISLVFLPGLISSSFVTIPYTF